MKPNNYGNSKVPFKIPEKLPAHALMSANVFYETKENTENL